MSRPLKSSGAGRRFYGKVSGFNVPIGEKFRLRMAW